MKKLILLFIILVCAVISGLHAQHEFTGPYIEDGLYYLKPAGSSRYLDVSGSCENKNGCIVQLYGIGKSDKNNKFYIRKTGNGVYTITSFVSGKVVEAQWETRDVEGGRVQIWDKVHFLGGDGFKGNQEWYGTYQDDGFVQFENAVRGVSLNLGVLKEGLNKNKTPVRLCKWKDPNVVEHWELIKVDQGSSSSSGTKKKNVIKSN